MHVPGGVTIPAGWGVPATASTPSFTNPNAPAAGATTGSGAAGGGAGGPASYTPDWTALINGDVGLKDALAALNAGAASDQNALNSEFANAYESFGKPIDLATLASQLGMTQADIQNALGPDVQKLAQENTDAGLSTVARLDQANTKAKRQMIAELNKKGILNSGEAGYQADQLNTGYRQAQQDAYQKFLGYLQQYQEGYLTAQRQRAAALAQAYSAAADRQYNLNSGYTPPGAQQQQSAPPAAPPPPPAGASAPAAPMSIVQALENYGIGKNPAQRVKFIGY